MLFNSFAFTLFLPTVFCFYWSIPSTCIRAQNTLLLIASYVFYGMWDWRFLSLIFISSLADYIIGLKLHRYDKKFSRKILFTISLIINFGFLGFFKYFDFFIESFTNMLSTFGVKGDIHTLNIILPVGISFYTFQTLSYTIDVYRKQIQPTRDPLAFFAFVSFFPQLVAGPIERAQSLLPQFTEPRVFDLHHAKDGLRQILWGLFKKVVIADNLGPYVEAIYSNYTAYRGIELAMGTVFFALQIYCDFSGYSDIAIGTGRLFGFRLSRNFAYPYFSRDIAEFWRRWHISLSSWFRDYLYIPLGGSRTDTKRRIRNVLVTFTLSGFWHGANWTFLAWGLLHGLYYVPIMLKNRHRQYTDTVAAARLLPSAREGLNMLITFVIVLFTWIFFRAASMEQALLFIQHMLSADWLVIPEFKKGAVYVGLIVAVEWFQRTKQHALQIEYLPPVLRWIIYYSIIGALFWYGHTGHVPFIYFQF